MTTSTVYVKRRNGQWRYSSDNETFQDFAPKDRALVVDAEPVAVAVDDPDRKIALAVVRAPDPAFYDVIATLDGDPATRGKGYVKVKGSG
jgi:hypothetical protein